MLTKKVFYLLTVLLIVAMLIIPVQGEAAGELSKLEQIKKAGKLVLGTTDDYPPYEFRMLGDKKVVGLDIDIANEIAKELGVKLEIQVIQFKDLIKSLSENKVDIVIAALSPTTERKKIVDFSKVYYKADQYMLINKNNKKVIKTVADLKGKKVGIQIGSVQMELAMKHVKASQFVEEDDMGELVDCLADGKCDAVLMEKPVAKSYAMKNPHLDTKACFLDKEKSVLGAAIAVKKGSKILLDKINSLLKQLQDKKLIAEFIEKSTILTADIVR
ncbi:MAG: transporter substrate-binding domain-containing protein [bacterium]|nr:transporter substrate-binding domain-containing protein [bacterium]